MAEKSYLGVDVGASNIKIVELKNDNSRPFLVTYGLTDRAGLSMDQQDDWLKDPSLAIKIIKDIYTKAKMKSRSAVAALPIQSVFSSIINLDKILPNKKEMDEAVKWQAKKVIPLPLEEMTIHWLAIEESKPKNNISSKPKGARVLLTAAPQKLVKKYLDIFKGAGLELISLETEGFALVRSLIGRDKAPIMIIDIGFSTTSFLVVNGGVPIFNKSVELGGIMVTKAIADGLQVDLKQADKFKEDISSGAVDSNKLPVDYLKPILASLEHEINYCMNLFNSENEQEDGRLEKIILTGGSSLLPGLAGRLSQDLSIKVYVGDPWARIIYPEDLKPVLDDIGPKMSVAAGLAMRNIV